MRQIYSSIPGLERITEYITKQDEEIFLEYIDMNPWYSVFTNRMQNYGYYESVTGINERDSNKDINGSLRDLVNRMDTNHGAGKMFNQILIREYLKGQGLVNYKNNVPSNSKVGILSLGEGCNITFISPEGNRIGIWVPRRSLLILKDDSLSKWNYTVIRDMIMVNDEDYEIEKNTNYRRIEITMRQV